MKKKSEKNSLTLHFDLQQCTRKQSVNDKEFRISDKTTGPEQVANMSTEHLDNN